jgi:hypothetical protein
MKRSTLVRLVSASIALLPLGIIGAPAPAAACGTGVFSVVNHAGKADPAPQQISSAERSLSQGAVAAAATQVFKVFPRLKTTQPGAGPLSDRALRILSLAAARADGALNVGSATTWPMAGVTPEQKEANLLFAIDTLRKLNEKRANNPSLQTDLAEALGKVPRFKSEAYAILTDLAKKDLVASAEGYATLAKLHEAMGEGAPRDAAVKRCEGMTKTPAACQVPATTATTSS